MVYVLSVGFNQDKFVKKILHLEIKSYKFIQRSFYSKNRAMLSAAAPK